MRKTAHKTKADWSNRIYRIYHAMKQRCYYRGASSYPNYGGRGIEIGPEWSQSFRAFESWSFANGYADDLTIDRLDNNGDYEPTNCRWTDVVTQRRGRRDFAMTVEKAEQAREVFKAGGITKKALADRYGVSPRAIGRVLSGEAWTRL